MGIIRRPHFRRATVIQNLPHRSIQGLLDSSGNGSRSPRNDESDTHGIRSQSSRFSARRRRFRNSYITPSSSEDEQNDSEGSISESSEDESCCDVRAGLIKNDNLLENGRFQFVRQGLFQLVLERFRAFIPLAPYSAPPDCRELPGNSLMETNWQPQSACPGEETGNYDQDDCDGFVMVPPAWGDCRLKCPFYAENPEKYRSCLVKHDLLTMENVLKHIKRHHTKPSYCPRCSKTFHTVVQCDQHIIRRACKLQELIKPEGINRYQRKRLTKRDNCQLSNTQRWERICSTVFPDMESIPSPYLDQGPERIISMARDFWKKQGEEWISIFLKSQDWLRMEEKYDRNAHTALYELVLEDLIEEIILE